METNTPLVIYHAPCTDGFTAAWACHKAHPDWDFRPQSHGGAFKIMDALDRDVYLLDFCFPRQDMVSLACVAKSITVLDHHKTALAAMEGFSDVLHDLRIEIPVDLIFDMDRSGAMMAWDHFNPGKTPPALVRMVQDRDLWRFTLNGTREMHAVLSSFEQTFDNWDFVERMHPTSVVADGQALLRKHDRDVKELAQRARPIVIRGHLVPAVNATHQFASDLGHVLAQDAPFAAVYSDDRNKRIWSLRSSEEGLDVSEIAKSFPGGGGHKHAAGFSTALDWVGDDA